MDQPADHRRSTQPPTKGPPRQSRMTDVAARRIRRLAGRARRKALQMLGGVPRVSVQSTPPRPRPSVRTRAATSAQQESASESKELTRLRSLLAHTRRELRAARASIREADYALPTELEELVTRVTDENLTYLKADYLRDLATLVRGVETSGVPGLVVEAGTALGGSAIVMAAAKDQSRAMKVYDVFGLIPAPTDQDGADVHGRYARIVAGEAKGVGDDLYYGYRDNLYDEVTDSFIRHGVPPEAHRVELIKGLFEDTIDLDEPIAFAHLDGDWYESTMTCLVRLAPLLSPGGRIVLDDYYAWSGCRRAVDEYFRDRPGFRLVKRAKLHVIRESDREERATRSVGEPDRSG